jgi:NADH-quinone oxidoreductase subunit N
VSAPQLAALAPLVGLAATSIVVMLAVVIRRDRRWSLAITLAGLATSAGLLLSARAVVPVRVTPLLLIDESALFFFALLIAVAAVVAVLASDYLRRRGPSLEEFLLLLLFATLGSCVLAASAHLASLFLGLEILSVSLYAMVGYLRDDGRSLEAGVKYLVLAALSSAFLLFGMALIYAETGSLEIAALAGPANPANGGPMLTLAGLALVLVGIGFKLALVPFHMWTADVYQGAPAPVTAFDASASKAAVVAVLLRLLATTAAPPSSLVWFMAILAAASIVVGNLLALLQDNLKRLLAYSSIAHLGYLTIAIIAGGPIGATAAAFYLAGYLPTTLIAFGTISALSTPTSELERIADVVGLGHERPALASLLTVSLLSLAGIPLTGGFVAKFLVVRAGLGAGWWTLALILVLGSVISIFYYLRPVVAMYMRQPGRAATGTTAAKVPVLVGLTLAALLAVVLWLGVWPSPVLEIARATVGSMF